MTDPLALSEGAPLALVVEDDPHAAEVASHMLAVLGYRSRVAVDATQALYALSEGPPALVLLDICLPEMDGVGLMKIMRRVQGMAAVPVVAASAVYPSEGGVARMLADQGVSTYLSKPFMLEELRRAVDAARSSALKVGRPPEATMTDGRIRAVPEPPAPAPEARPDRPAPPAPPAPSKPAAAAQAPARPRPVPPAPVSIDRPLSDSTETERPAPWSPGAPPPAAAPSSTAVDAVTDVVAQGLTAAGPVGLVLEGLGRTSARVRSVDRRLARDQTVRTELTHHIPVHDAMTDVHIRMILRVLDCDDFGRGSSARCQVIGARPAAHFDALVAWFERR